MKVYIAGKLSQREQMHSIRERLWLLGYDMTPFHWIDDHTTGYGAEWAHQIAMRDLEWIASADIVILDTTEPFSPDSGGGREFEFGYATGKKILWRVGPCKSAFHALAVRAWPSWDALFAELERPIELAERHWERIVCTMADPRITEAEGD